MWLKWKRFTRRIVRIMRLKPRPGYVNDDCVSMRAASGTLFASSPFCGGPPYPPRPETNSSVFFLVQP